MTPDFTQTPKPCADCNGSGVQTYEVRTYGGRWTGEEEERDCERCQGEGFIELGEVESVEKEKAA